MKQAITSFSVTFFGLLLAVFVVLSLNDTAVTDSGAVSKLMGLGMSGELAYRVDQEYAAAVNQSVLPSTDATYNLGSTSKTFATTNTQNLRVGAETVTMAATPTWVARKMVNVVTTAAASAGILLPSLTSGTSGDHRIIVSAEPTRSVLVWPNSNSASTPAAITYGSTVGAAGTPATLAAGKSLDCTATGSAQWYCFFGGAS